MTPPREDTICASGTTYPNTSWRNKLSTLDVGLWAFSILATAIITVAVTKYYSRRQVQRQLTAYLDVHSSPFQDLAQDVRDKMELSYENRTVRNLRHIEFVIVNTGQLAIRDCEEPLTVRLPDGITDVMDATITDQSPGVGAAVPIPYWDSFPNLSYTFRLLNPNEWFRLKILLDAPTPLEPMDWTFSIRGENISPTVPVRHARVASTDKGSRLANELITTAFLVGATMAGGLVLLLLNAIGMDFQGGPKALVVLAVVLVFAAGITGGILTTVPVVKATIGDFLPEGAARDR